MKRLSLIFVAIGVLVVSTILGFLLSQISKPDYEKERIQYQSTNQVEGEKISFQSSPPETFERQSVKVIRVIDGDTIEIEGNQKIRYIGIDTPETVHPDKSVQCFGTEATNKNKELVEGKTIALEKDVSETDKYGRLLRYIFVRDPSTSSRQVFVNDYLVRQGFANSSSYPPDVKYQEQFQRAQDEARQNNRGLWGECQLKEDQSQTSSQSVPESGCTIKGNVSSTGEKIYHMSDQYYYEKTVIDESRGEKWFCTEEEATSAGWRKSMK